MLEMISQQTHAAAQAPYAPAGRGRAGADKATDTQACSAVEEMRFRRFRLIPRARILLRANVAVEIGSRAFDLLHVLLACKGTVVSKPEIMSRVWPSTFVDDSNLRFQMCRLRRALDSDCDVIKTVPGRGYLLSDERDDGEAAQLARGDHRQIEPCVGEVANGGAIDLFRSPAHRRVAPLGDPRAKLEELLRLTLQELRRLNADTDGLEQA